MSRKSVSAIFDKDAPITQADIKSGKLVSCKRALFGKVLPNKQHLNKTMRQELGKH